MHLFKIISTLFLCEIFLVVCQNQPEVRISQGALKGKYIKTLKNRQIASFEGIPYAKPPAGKHRFKAPVSAGLWYGILNATRKSPICLQYDFFVNPPQLLGSEDCLYINVYTPKLPAEGEKFKLLDVIAYIHGGAFVVGKSNSYSPFVLLDRDVLLVTFNYRVGALGFLSTEDHVVPGNNGLKDQVLALKWIQENIAAFGGNPKSVTLGGLSAGGSSCHLHMLSPSSKGLFKGAICMSGIALNPMAISRNLNEKTKAVAHELGCPINDSLIMVNCLRNRPAEHIVELTKKFLYWKSHPMVPYGPVIEPVGPDAFISEAPIDIIKNKSASDVPNLITFVADEGSVGVVDFIAEKKSFNEFLNRWDELIPVVLDFNYNISVEKRLNISQRIRDFYKVDASSEGRKNIIKMIGDRAFVSDISKLAKIYSPLYSSPMYIYRFSYRGKHSVTEKYGIKENLGVAHGDDVYYILRDYFKQFEDDSDYEISQDMLDVITSFAANGTLGTNWQPTKEQWPKVTFTDILGPKNFKLTVADELGEERFWDSLGIDVNNEPPSGTAHEEL